MGNKYIIMLVGYTHSGKTTFAKNFIKNNKDFTMIDNDEIASFLNKTYPLVVHSNYNKIKRNFKEPNLKFLISTEIFKFSLKANLNIIHASGNLGKDARLLVTNNAKKFGYKLITVYFNLPRDILLNRIKNSKKPKDCFKLSKNWDQVFEKQELYAELPPSKKNTIYYEIQDKEDYQKVLKELQIIIKK